MAANPNWARWVMATFIKSLETDAAAASLEMHFQFGPPRSPSWETAKTKAETTISGPRVKRLSPTLHLIFVDVFMIVTSNLSSNNYDHLRAVGAMQEALDKCYLVKDFGDTGLSEIGKLSPRKGTDDELIEITHIQPSEEDTQIHSTLFARYEGRF